MSSTAAGHADPAFADVKSLFEAGLAHGDDLGAAVAVFVDGRAVVDLWGGIADRRTGRPWRRDTACPTFSCTKGVTATAALMVAQQHGRGTDEPVSTWWPEFAQHDKRQTTLADLMAHRAGLPVLERPVSVAQAADPAAMADLLAHQTPLWQPGTEHGYHALTFGWLVGEFVRRHTGLTVGEFTRRHVGDRLLIGASGASAREAARISAPPPEQRIWSAENAPPIPDDTVAEMIAAIADPESLFIRSSSNPVASYNDPEVLAAGWPASGLVATARDLAKFYADLISGALVAPGPLREAATERTRGRDRVLRLESAFGLGYMLPSQNFVVPEPAQRTAFGHPGAGGSVGLADLEHKVAFAFVPNLRRDWMAGDRRAYRLIAAVYGAL
ncbi:serine hydrolase domain-containing protein [Mycolicibacterium frederiksbergense]|jgi:CubicO group peptidase (beta-lactamase class C family)|uniref:serine hydrolase domain-containing protein n=1 Tax=Mycolicibacterium frederiksbergense TaxID=117567 RepID=UPI0039996B79